MVLAVLTLRHKQNSLLRTDSADLTVACFSGYRTTQHVQAVGIINDCTDSEANDSTT